jgi:hypothetical protein
MAMAAPDRARAASDAVRKAVAEGGAIVRGVSESLRKPRKDRSLPVRKPPAAPTEDDGPPLLDMVAHIIAAERAGRLVTAALGLARLREVYEGLDPATGAGWAEFVHTYLEPAIGLSRINELIGRMVHRGAMLRCSQCEAETRCPCGCGVPYVSQHRWAKQRPVKERSAQDRAAAAIAAHPEMSDRAIAEQIGVGHQTVMRARRKLKRTREDGPVGGPVDSRVGRDGRRRRPPAGTTGA